MKKKIIVYLICLVMALGILPAASVQAAPGAVSVSYSTHVEDYGWQAAVRDGAVSGTSAESKRLEGIRISVSGDASLGIEYATHVQDTGWQGFVNNGAMSGTSGQSKRLEAIQINLTGASAELYDIYYRVHAQNTGWMDWARDGASAGTAGYSYRLEAIQIVIVPAGAAEPDAAIPASVSDAFMQKTAIQAGAIPAAAAPADADTVNTIAAVTGAAGVADSDDALLMAIPEYTAPPAVLYKTHVQDFGWQSFVRDGATSGTSGQSMRLEAIQITMENVSGSIEYKTHVQDIGWMDWASDSSISGTSGQSKRLEAIQIRLTGAAADQYDIYYRVHAQNTGWMDWAKNGESAGTEGYAYRLEAIQIILTAKNAAAPGATALPFKQAPAGYLAEIAANSWTWPLSVSHLVNSPYGYRWHPIYGTYKLHAGIDICADFGSSVTAAKGGTVIASSAPVQGENYGGSNLGNYIKIDHGDGYMTVYAHLQRTLVSVGDTVSAGQLIGLVGSTGASTGAHLHFEVRIDGTADNPLNYVS